METLLVYILNCFSLSRGEAHFKENKNASGKSYPRDVHIYTGRRV